MRRHGAGGVGIQGSNVTIINLELRDRRRRRNVGRRGAGIEIEHAISTPTGKIAGGIERRRVDRRGRDQSYQRREHADSRLNLNEHRGAINITAGSVTIGPDGQNRRNVGYSSPVTGGRVRGDQDWLEHVVTFTGTNYYTGGTTVDQRAR